MQKCSSIAIGGIKKAAGGGIALQGKSSSLVLLHCTFVDCVASNWLEMKGKFSAVGGALRLAYLRNSVTLTQTSFVRCIASSGNRGIGGAISHEGGDGGVLKLHGCVLNRCSAISRYRSYGGGIAIHDDDACGADSQGSGLLVIEGSTLANCTAETSDQCGRASLVRIARGGGLYIVHEGRLSVSRSYVDSCHAISSTGDAGGGGLYFAPFFGAAGGQPAADSDYYLKCTSSQRRSWPVHPLAGWGVVKRTNITHCKVMGRTSSTGGGVCKKEGATLHLFSVRIMGCAFERPAGVLCDDPRLRGNSNTSLGQG